MLTRAGWGAVLVLAILVIPGGALPGSAEANAVATAPVESVESTEIVDSVGVESTELPGDGQSNQRPIPPAEPVTEPELVVGEAGGELLRYGVERGDRLGYSFELQLKYPDNETSWTGAVHVAETGGDVHEMNLSVDRFALSQFAHPVPGPDGRMGLLPRDRIPRMFPPTPSFPSRLRERIGPFPGPFPDVPGLGRHENIERMDRQGRHIGAVETDEFPFMIGNVASLLFPRLPSKSFKTWDSEETRMERFAETTSSFGMHPLPFEEPEKVEKAVQYNVTWELLGSSETERQYRRTVLSETLELVDGEPAMSLQMTGTLVWDCLTGSWKSLEYAGRGTERKSQLETRVPLTLQIKRQ